MTNIKRLITITAILFSGLVQGQDQVDAFFNNLDTFLGKHVIGNRIDYYNIKKSPLELNNLVSTIQYTPLDSVSESNKKAYLINAYNLLVIKKVVDNYPIQSPQEIGSFYDDKMSVGGEKYSLNQIENDLLRKVYKDKRLHFVLVCGAIGCPPIANKAFKTSSLEQQIDLQTKKSLNDNSFIYTKNNTLFLSEIFKWYREDFGGKDIEIIQFINSYRSQNPIPDIKIDYYKYNWTLNDIEEYTSNSKGVNLQTFTAGSLLGKGNMDITLFNTLYTQTKSNWKGVDFYGERASFHTSLFQFTYGISKNKRVNIGFDINLKASSKSSYDTTYKSAGNTYALTNTDSTRFGVSSIGPRIKLAPFKKLNSFSMQSTFLVPTIKHPEGFSSANPEENLMWSDWSRYIWWNQFYYDVIYKKFQFFFEIDLLARLRRNKDQISHLDTPLNLFISYFATKKLTFYAMGQHVNRFTNDSRNVVSDGKDWIIPMNYSAYGIGTKYQILHNMNIEFLYTNFWRGVNSGIGSTFNIGIKYLTN